MSCLLPSLCTLQIRILPTDPDQFLFHRVRVRLPVQTVPQIRQRLFACLRACAAPSS